MNMFDEHDNWPGPAQQPGPALAAAELAALMRTREALVYGPDLELQRPVGWPGLRQGDALASLAPEAFQQVVLLDLLCGLRVQVEGQTARISHGRMQHQVSAAGLDLPAELALLEARADLRPERAAEVLAQQRFNPTFWARILPLDAHRTPHTLALVQAGLLFSACVVQRVKAVVHHPRPAELSPRIQPMIPAPGFSSFPGLQATQAALVAGLLWVLVSRRGGGHAWGATLKNMLDELAARIAENREVAGLHFHADSVAGKALGDKLLAAMLEAKAQNVNAQRPQDGHALAWLWQQAAVEWGTA